MQEITAVAWIPCNRTPAKLNDSIISEEEMARYISIISGGAPVEPIARPQPELSTEDQEIIKKYNMENYDDEDEAGMGVVAEDPYQTGPLDADPAEDDDDTIRPTDLLLMCGKTGDAIPSLEVQLFDPKEESFYVHHEVLIPAFPLCIKWLDFEPMSAGNEGSFAAISTYESFIEIWDMTVSEPMAPKGILQGHEQPVPGLSWNMNQRNLLLSASIDQKAAIWELQRCQHMALFNVGSPCKACEWHPEEATIFGIAAESGAAFYDARNQTPAFTVLGGTAVECLTWLPPRGSHFILGDLSGNLTMWDFRNPGQPVSSIAAHQEAVTSISACTDLSTIPIIATTGEDGYVKLWNIASGAFVHFAEEDMEHRLYTSSFCPDKPTLLAVGGDDPEAKLWDIANLITAAASPASAEVPAEA